MARRPATESDAADLELNMTPMIDVVFQLITFLMLANDMSRKEIEDLVLPPAVNGTEDTGIGEEHRLIVNLLPDAGDPGGRPIFRVRGEDLDLDGFRRVLGPEADRARAPGGDGDSALHVLVRADRRSRWQDVQWVLQACADPGIRVRRLQFGVTDPDVGGK